MSDTSRVHPALAEALTTRGYETLTQVQQAVISEQYDARDLLVSAQTGSGKTVAFGLAMAGMLLGEKARFGKGGAPLALIVAPTRELALQVRRELEWLYAKANAKITSCVGGMDVRDERRALKGGVHIVVGTPGRLSDHIRRRSLDTSNINTVVLDEADEMLDMGFREELEHILGETPVTRRTLMFSATVPRGIAALAKRYQRDAIRVKTEAEASQHIDIDYHALLVAPGDEENAIINILRHSDAPSALVFCSTRAAVNRMVTRFGNRGLPVVALSGELSQKERNSALQAMRSGRARVCIATDVAARGLDLPALDLVIHSDLPRNSAGLLHRSGRTGRAGRKGVSALIVQPRARRRAERLLDGARIDARWGKPPSANDIKVRDDERLLNDPALATPVAESEAALAAALIEKYGAEQIAAALIRQSKSAQGAPEELRDVQDKGPRSAEDKARDRERAAKRSGKPVRERNAEEFADSTWIELSVGRKKNAEARWLIPMLCKVGGLTSKQIGAIRINQGNTHVQLTSEAAEAFFAELDTRGSLEKGVSATRMDGTPDPARHKRRDRPAPHAERQKRSSAPARKGPYIAKKPGHAAAKSSAQDSPKTFDPDRPSRKKDRHRNRPENAASGDTAARPRKPGRKRTEKGPRPQWQKAQRPRCGEAVANQASRADQS